MQEPTIMNLPTQLCAGGPGSVVAPISYIGDMAEPPVVDVENRANSRIVAEPREVRFVDARPIADSLSLDVQGFKLIRHRTATRDFHDPTEVDAVYLREMEQVVQRETGADLVISAVGPIMRLNDPASERAIPPASLAHSDYTDFTLRTQIGFQADLNAPEFQEYSRIVAYQTWRALSPPPQDSTLAFCDARSVSTRDRVLSTFITMVPQRATLEFYMYKHNPAHRWYYFPDLQRDELLIFKGFEGDGDDKQNVLHGAFSDPTCPGGAVPRESIETRAFAFFRD
jgi:hypothetical protein